MIKLNLRVASLFLLFWLVGCVQCVWGQQGFTDKEAFLLALGTPVVVDFEGITEGPGQQQAKKLLGNEFVNIQLYPGIPSQGLFVGIPDLTIDGRNNVNFFAHDFHPTSGVAVYAPMLVPPPGISPHGILVVNFATPTKGVGAYFLDVDTSISSLQVYDDFSGEGALLGRQTVTNVGDNTQAFAGVIAPGIRSAVFVLGNAYDGLGLDDLIYSIPEVSVSREGIDHTMTR